MPIHQMLTILAPLIRVSFVLLDNIDRAWFFVCASEGQTFLEIAVDLPTSLRD